MVRTSRRQTLLRTTLPAVEHVEPPEETAIDFSSQPADEADQQTAETDHVQEAEQRIDADRLLPVLIQEMNLPQEAKDPPRPLKRYFSRSVSRLCVHVFVNLSGPTPKPPTKIYPHTQPTPTTHNPTNTQHRSIPNGQQTSNNRPP